MTVALQRLPWSDLVALLAAREDVGWLALVCESLMESALFERVRSVVVGVHGAVCSFYPVTAAEQLIERDRDDVRPVVLGGLDRLGEADWRRLDAHREVLRGRSQWTVVMTRSSVEMFSRAAPHLLSMVGSAFELSLDVEALTSQEREKLVKGFEERLGMTSAELLERATAGERPGGADYVAWIVLLGKGELL